MKKNVGHYPSGPINQHKALATGAKLQGSITANKETVPKPWGGGKPVEGKVHKSGTSTGSGGSSSTVSHKVTPA